MQKTAANITVIVILILALSFSILCYSSSFYNQNLSRYDYARTLTHTNKDSALIQPIATFSFPFPFATPTPTPSPTPIPTPTPVPTPKPILFMPTIDIAYRASTEDSRFRVEIYGMVKTNTSAPIVDAPILVAYSGNGSVWESISLVRTQSNGAFTAVWISPSTGNYTFRASIDETPTYYSSNQTVSCELKAETMQPIITQSTPWITYAALFVAIIIALTAATLIINHQRNMALKKKYEIKH